MRTLSVIVSLVLSSAVGVVAAGSSAAETIRLKTGQTLIGDVTLSGDDVVVDVRFPATGTLRLRRADLAPESLYDVLERRTDANDAKQRMALAETAESLGLPGQALAEYRRVLALDPASAGATRSRVAALEERLATDLLRESHEFLDGGMPNAALLRLHAVLEQYPTTDAAKRAQRVLTKAHEAAGASAEVARRTVPFAGAGKVADEVEADLKRGDAARAKVAGHEGSGGSADLRAVERAIDAYEAGWKGAKSLPAAPTPDAVLNARITALRTRSKDSLVAAYLEAGTILLQRRAVVAAERWCDKACELDPEHKTSHELHRLILEAQATNWRGSRAR